MCNICINVLVFVIFRSPLRRLTFLCHPIGGSRGSQSNTWSTTETWKYITREGKWVTVAPMLRPRTNHTSAALNGEIYVIGGKKINMALPHRVDAPVEWKSFQAILV